MYFDYEENVLDLHDVALLLNYERASAEPRFRHAKLREVARNGADFKTIKALTPEWTECLIPRTGYVFDKPRRRLSKNEAAEADLPSNILPTPIPENLQNLSPQDLELCYWQPRNHDGCFRTVALFQHFIDLFPEFTRIRVRVVENKKPRMYSTLANDRLIVEMNLFQPITMNLSCVLPDNQTYITGCDEVSLHAVLGFPPPGGDVDVILDLSSMQFGDVGRGFNGKGLFVLEPKSQYVSRLDKFAKGNDFSDAKESQRIRHTPDDDWLKEAAKRTKERWDKRSVEPWCGHCGAPACAEPLKRCAKCHRAHYYDAAHQLAAWPFHKHFCVEVKK